MASLCDSTLASPNEPIAIIGSGCRFAGGCDTPSKLWDLLRQPYNVASEIPPERFNPNGHYYPEGSHHGTSNVRESYLLSEDIRQFDAQFFGIKAVEANSIDPQQRLLLETVYESVESAGLRMEKLKGSHTAVYVGLMCGDYSDMMTRDPDAFPTYFATGTARSILSNRVSYFFDWHGPSMTIDTACSSSLIAVHQAVQVLRSRECQIAVAAGSNLIMGPEPYIAESKLKMLSPTGRSRMWDAGADGYARGDGVAAIVMKSLSQALKDGDNIDCIIRETGINHDGRTKGITMPSATAQTALIRSTYTKAGLDLSKNEDRPQYFEAHGTGTPTGDPLEAEAISSAFFGKTAKYRTASKKMGGDTLYVGSIKTVIGHTEGTAGLAGILKAMLSLQHRTIPPNMLMNNLNPAIVPYYDNLEVPTTELSWPQISNSPRRASVNSFGFGGSNAHVILESWEPPNAVTAPNNFQNGPAFTPFIFSANSEKALSNMLKGYSDYLDSASITNLRDLSWTLNYRRSTLSVQAVIAGATLDSLQDKLNSAATDIGSVTSRTSAVSEKANRILGVFTGQGAQWAGMGRQLILESEAASRIIQRLEQHLAQLPTADRPKWSIRSELFADAKSSRLNEASLSQTLCTAVQIMLVDLLHAAGIHFDAVVGHSSGEIGAAYAAGYLTACDSIRIAYYRGLHAKLAKGNGGMKGAMMAVGTPIEDANELCTLEAFDGRICVAASNSSTSVTISGDADAIEEAKDVYDEESKFARKLKVDTAYHSYHMLLCSEPYLTSLIACDVQIQQPDPTCTWISSVYVEPVENISDKLTSSYWNNNMVRPVLFSQAVECAVGEKGPFKAVVEVGPHPALKGPTTDTIQNLSGDEIPYTGVLSRGKNDIEAFASGLGYIMTNLGDVAVNLEGYDRFISGGAQPNLLKGLPSYPWEHENQYWHESRLSKAYRIREGPFHELLGFKCEDGTEREVRWRNLLRPKEIPWLHGHQIQGQIVFPGAGYISTVVEAAKVLIVKEAIRLVEIHDLKIGTAVTFDDDDSSVETLLILTEIDMFIHEHLTANFSFYSSASPETSTMTLNASGRIQVIFGTASEADLPLRQPEDFNMLDVPETRFYESLAELGFNYNQEFKNLSSLRRKLGTATGIIANPPNPDLETSLLIHPAMLDGAIQSIILAYCWPGDGRLWSIHVPVGIRRIRINMGLCRQSAGKDVHFPFDASLANTVASNVDGDVDVYAPDGQHCMLQVEGMTAVPFSGATLANDFHLFSELVWKSANPDAESIVVGGRATDADYELAFVMERVAYYYTRSLHKSVSDAQRAHWNERHHENLFQWGEVMLQRVKDGVNQVIKKEWVNTTHDQILNEIAKYPDSIDLKVMYVVGENMPSVVRGETTILEHLIKGNMLDDYYVHALGFEQYTKHLARMIAQITHRYPRMNILEIGAGTGGATKAIFGEVGSAFASYAFTDISSGFFEKAQDVFQQYSPKMIFKSLNIEQDITDQGFVEGSYDLVVASLVIHATKNLEETLTNVRRLLKPGGYLVLLEITNNNLMRLGFIFGCLPGWWLGVDDNRKLSPCIPTSDWDAIFRRTGFSGVEATTPDPDSLPYPLSVLCTQAINDRISFLREPISAMPSYLSQENLVVIGGNTSKTALLVEKIIGLLPQRSCTHTVTLEQFDIENSTVSSVGTVLSLVDLEEPIFKSMTSSKLQGLKALFEKSKNIIWVTQGANSGDPYANMIVGFGRCILLEMPQVHLQLLDIEMSDEPDPGYITDTLLRFEVSRSWEESGELEELLWSIEPEIRVQKRKQVVPRLKLKEHAITNTIPHAV